MLAFFFDHTYLQLPQRAQYTTYLLSMLCVYVWCESFEVFET